jgi:hypothetical protein
MKQTNQQGGAHGCIGDKETGYISSIVPYFESAMTERLNRRAFLQ